MIIMDKSNPRITLDKAVKSYQVDLTWNPQTRSGDEFDLDLYMAVLHEKLPVNGGLLPKDADLVYHRTEPIEINGKKIIQHPSGCVVYTGDDKTGKDGGERAFVYLDKIPEDKGRITFAVEIAHALHRHQTFGDVTAPTITLTNPETGIVEVTIELDESFTTENCMIAFEIYKKDGELKARRIAQGFKNGLMDFLKEQGFEVAPRNDF